MAASALLACLPLMAEEPAVEDQPEEELQELETIVIVGSYATPRMWKVSKADHVMWVLGMTGSPPAGVKWNTGQVEARVAESQLVLYPGWVQATPDVSLLKMVTLIPAAMKAAKNPDGKKLKDVLPPDIYARWRVLKTTYVGRDDDIERWRPSIAIGMLESEVWKKLRPPVAAPVKQAPPAPSLRSVVDKTAKKNKVKVRTMPNVERKVPVKNVREIVKSAYHTDFGDQKCFAQQLEQLEKLIEYMKQRSANPAQASATAPRQESCEDFLIKGLRSGEIPDPAGALKILDEVARQLEFGRHQLDSEWVAAAQGAMTRNKATFAMLPMRQITGSENYLLKLKSLGYEVEELK